MFGDLIDGSESERCDGDLHVCQATNYRLNFRIVDTVQRLDHHEVILLLGILQNRSLHRCEMLLVGQINVIEKRTLAWKECAGKLETLGVPELGFALLARVVKGRVFFHLDDETDLSAVAEVSYS